MLFAFLCIVGTSSAQNATTNPEAPSLSAGNTATATYPSVESQARNGVELRITHSDTQTIGGMIACGADGITTINSYYRDFDLENFFGVVEDFIVDRVEFGVVVGPDTEAGTEMSVAIWAWDSGSTFPEGAGVELGRASYLSTPADQGTVVSVPLAATVPAGSVMVYEVTHAGDTTFRIAGNEEGQTGVSWIEAVEGCNLGITDLADINFPTYSTVMNVWGYEATPLVYCGPLDFVVVEPITLVFGAGINNATSAVVGGTPATEDFTTIVGEMEQGGTYTIDIAGNTDGPFTDYFVIFMDWNQNGILNDEGEVYEYTEILTNSTGTDGQFVSNDIVVPVDAALGETRMRVKKIYGTFDFLDPCLGTAYGQAEDYTISVGVLSTNDNVIEGFSYYPNPSSDVINLSAKQNIEKAAIYNILGQKVIDQNINATSSRLNVANLNTGTYLMQVTVDGKTATYKILKN